MKSNKIELKELLKKLNSGEDVSGVKEEARALLERISPKELSETEQKLINEGLPETELRHLCEAHIEVMAEELKALKAEMEEGHPLQVLIVEHDEILKVLDRLEQANKVIQEMNSYDCNNDVFKELKEISYSLVNLD